MDSKSRRLFFPPFLATGAAFATAFTTLGATLTTLFTNLVALVRPPSLEPVDFVDVLVVFVVVALRVALFDALEVVAFFPAV